ncbi:MAG TPA: hypothetical protein VIW01_08295 [Dehalococcoidia bacterium]
MKYLGLALIAVLLAMAVAACGGDDNSGAGSPTATAPADGGIDPADFSTVIDNPLFPLSSFTSMIYEGEEVDPDTDEAFTTRVEMTVLPETKTVAGVEVLVVQDQAFEDGELIESTLDYYAQHTDGSVYYFGEDVDNYEDGELKDHEGSWLAGEGENQPGIIMPPVPAVGDVFQQEKAPGIAEDEMTVLSLTESVSVPAGDFTDCLETEDVNPLDEGAVEFKYYCQGVGFVLEEFEDGNLQLISYE